MPIGIAGPSSSPNTDPAPAQARVPAYEQVTCPVLYLVGENDENLPAHESATRVGEALRRAGNSDYTVRVLPGASHMLNLSYPRITDMARTEASGDLHDFRFSPGYPDLVSDWILARQAPGMT